jgi:hypothetical protein
MEDRRRTFADETTTGIRPELRGLFKATIAARIDTENLEWWLRFGRDFLPPGAEPKSFLVMPIIDICPTLQASRRTPRRAASILLAVAGEYRSMSAVRTACVCW